MSAQIPASSMVPSVLALLLLLGAARGASAEVESHEMEVPAGEHEGWHANHLAVFAGLTQADHDGHAREAATVGLDYQRRLTRRIGVGFVLDRAGEEIDSNVAAAGLWWHAVGGLHLLVAPGIERSHSHSEFLLRLGVGYGFQVGENVSLGPTWNVDFVDGEEAQVFGLSLGFGW